MLANYKALQVICSKEVLSSLVIQCVPLNMSVWTICHHAFDLASSNFISLTKTVRLSGLPFFHSVIHQTFSEGLLYARRYSGHLGYSSEQNG